MPAQDFWDHVDHLVASSQVAIDRPKGSAHTLYPDMIYPLDYGYLVGTTSGDGSGIDVWVGSLGGTGRIPTGIVCSVDLLKRDAELKILLGCTDVEMQTIVDFVNDGDTRCILVKR